MIWGVILFFACCVLFFRLKFFKSSGINPSFISILFALKLFSGICLLFIYTYFYEDRKTGDVFKYLDDSKIIWNYSKFNLIVYFKILFGIDNANNDVISVLNCLDHWYLNSNANFITDSRLIIRFNLLLYPISNGNQYIHLVLLGLWSFLGQVALYKTFAALFNEKTKALIAVFFIPSFVFWSSGILKEGILVGFLGFFTWYSYKLSQKITFFNFIKLLVMWLGILFSKFYVAFCLISTVLNLFFQHLIKVKNNVIKFTSLGLVITAFTIFFFAFLNSSVKLLVEKQNQFINVSKGGYFVEQFKDTIRIEYELGNKIILFKKDSGYLDESLRGFAFVNLKDTKNIELKAGKKNSFRILKIIIGAKSNIKISEINDIRSLIKNLPEYISNVVLRPFPNETHNFFQLVNLIENFAFIIAFIICIIWFKKPKFVQLLWLISFLVFVFILYSLIGSTTPVIGAIVRYKIPALPFLWLTIFVLIDEIKMQKFFKSVSTKKI